MFAPFDGVSVVILIFAILVWAIICAISINAAVKVLKNIEIRLIKIERKITNVR